MKKIILIALVFINIEFLSAKEISKHEIKSSIVKIFTVANNPSFRQPWTSLVKQFTGSGCIIDGDKILTNAHVVTDSTYVEVLKNGEIKRYEAEVLSISHDSDLALITVKDKSFFENTVSLTIGKLPNLQEKVTVYGFPTGGDTLSITKGVISRIEHQRYVHSGKYLLAIQIDAPINSGNSGGPALSNGKIVGIVMQGRKSSQSIGYIIPPSVINHFLDDMKDGKYHGYPFLGVVVQNLESPILKEMYNLSKSKYGILVNQIIPNSPASRILKLGDILTSIDGYKVFTNSKVEFRDQEYTDFTYPLDIHQIGDEITLEVIRDKKQISLKVKLDKNQNELMLIKKRKYEKNPTYYIYGGLVFVPAINKYKIPSKYYKMFPDEKREELVLLHRVLSSELTKGFNQVGGLLMAKVNNKEFKNFNEFVSLIENSKEKYIIFEDVDNNKVVLKREDVVKKQKDILARYNIKTSKSDDLNVVKVVSKSNKL